MERIATIGFFDGVHTGHQYLFEHMQREGKERGLEPLIITFDVHPRSALQSDYTPHLLTTLEERKQLLMAYGEVMVLPFMQIQPLTADAFMQKLKEEYGVKALVMGYDHQFGSDRLHKAQDYRMIGAQNGVEVIHLGEFIDGEWHVSSTEIRTALRTGNIVVANELLGRAYSLRGRVIHGKGVGRKMGFPTANIQPESEEKIVPKNGVYAVAVRTEAMEWRSAMLNIGTNPTVGNTGTSIEVHIPHFVGDLYGEEMAIRFERYIREEKRFDTIEELQAQIAEDLKELG